MLLMPTYGGTRRRVQSYYVGAALTTLRIYR
jgi:hypothetical protein